MIKKTTFKFLYALVFSLFCIMDPPLQAEDASQNMPGQIQDDSYYKNLTIEEDEEKNPIGLPDMAKEDSGLKEDKLPPAPMIMESKKYSENTVPKKSNILIPEQLKTNGGQYLEYKNSEIAKSVSSFGNAGFSIGYYTDNFDYKDPGNIYERTYKTSSNAKTPGSLQISYEYFFFRTFLAEVFTGANVGLGYHTGKGRFSDGTESRAQFQLWTIPIDATLGAAIPIGQWAKLAVEGGPSLMEIMQTRSDKEDDEKTKRRRQFSTGYYAEARFGVSLSRLIPGLGRSLFEEYEATQFFLNFAVRMQNYENFKDDFKISGSSYGIQFAFEYL